MSHSHITASSSSESNFQLIISNALEAYRKRTKQDLFTHPLGPKLQACDSPGSILAILQQQIHGLDQSGNSADQWTKWLDPTINVLFAFTASLAGAGLPCCPANAIFAGISVLLSAVKDVRASRATLMDIFERIELFFRRLEVYADVPPTAEMMDTIVLIMVEVISVLGVATVEIRQGRLKKFGKKLIGRTEIEDALKRLDKLTQEEARMAIAQNLKATHAVDERVKGVANTVVAVDERVACVDDRVASVDYRVGRVDDRVARVDDKVTSINDKVASVSDDTKGIDARVAIVDDSVKTVDRKVDEVILDGKEAKQVMKQTANDVDQVKRDQLRRDVQRWLFPPDPSTNHNFVRKARHVGTAEWFFESKVLTEWKAGGSLLWIHGKPGAGKSTLISSIIQDIKEMHTAGLATMAYYYFDFRDVRKQDCYGLLSSLVFQLSVQSDSCFDILSEIYSDLGRGIQKPDIDALKKCMTDMLSLPGQPPIYIIVDGVDECPNFPGRPSARGEVLGLIEGLVDLKLPNAHLCVASRPEMDIRMVLEPLTSLKISLHDELGQKEDIVAYIRSVVRSDPSMRKWKEEDKQLVIDTLSERADGMFRWVVCQVERLCRTFPASIRIVLRDLPKTLDETYGHTLLSIDEEKREYARRLFQCLTVAIRPLRVEELADILAVRFDKAELPTFNAGWRPENAEEAVISACSSLIAIVDREGGQVVQFSHFSVKEFLTSERLSTTEGISCYHILPEAAHTTLAHAGLSILLQLDEKAERKTINRFPLAPYAARYWLHHALYKNVFTHIQQALARLFDPAKPHFAAWVWLHDIDRHWIEPMSKKHPTRPEAVPLYYAAMAGFRGLAENLIAAHPKDIHSRGGSHTTPLHAASFKGHLEVASLLLKSGADPNSLDDLLRVPLHRVSQGGQLVMTQSSLEIARLLVNSGAKVNVIDDEGWTPLHVAARSGYREIMELLLGSGASLDPRTKHKQTPLHVACFSGKLDISRFLIDQGSDQTSQDQDGFIPLHIASRYGNFDIASLLLDRGSDVNGRESRSWTPLHHASRYGHLDIAQLLMDRGADIDAYNDDHWTPLHLASAFGQLDIAKLLVKRGANVDSRTDKEETPLDRAAWNGHLDIARFLLESGAAMSPRDYKGCTPFHTASFFGHLNVMKFFIECGIDINLRNGGEQTPFILVSGSGKLPSARFLLEQGADIHAKDNSGWNSLHIASQNGHLDVVQMLLKNGVAIDIRDLTQMTPLAWASSKGKVDVVRFLIEWGADFNVRDKEGCAPIHFASGHGHLDVTRLILDHGVDANIARHDLWSPLHLASADGHLDVAELLVERGANVEVFNDKQETPLYQAAWNGKCSIARFLIDHGANLHVVDSNGWTSLHAASQRGHLEVLRLLLRRGADIDALDKANKTAANLASENDKAGVVKFIAKYKVDARIRNKIRSTTMDKAEYPSDEDEMDETKTSLHVAAEQGNIDLMKTLIDRGADVNGRNANFQSPLHRGAYKGYLNVVRLLVERGAEVESHEKRGWTPLHVAAGFGHPEVLRLLLDHGADVNARQENHNTPMHLSAENGHLEIVKQLLERGADVYSLNGDGQTAYQISLAYGHREVAELLQEHASNAGRASPY